MENAWQINKRYMPDGWNTELYNQRLDIDPNVLIQLQTMSDEEELPILWDEVVHVVLELKTGKAAGADNISAKFIIHGGDAARSCNNIWQSYQWPTLWTWSLIITLPKQGDLQQCNNHRTISLISHASKVMLKILLNCLQARAEEVIAEEQAGFQANRNMTEQIFNLHVLSEKYSQH